MRTGAAGSSLTDGDASLVFPNISCLLIIAWTTAAASLFYSIAFYFSGFSIPSALHLPTQSAMVEIAPRSTQRRTTGSSCPYIPPASDAVELTAAQVGLLSMEMTHKRLKTYQVNRSAQEAASLTAQGGKLGADKFVRAV